MNLTAWFKLMSFATVTSLIYIHMQMQIVELAYKGKDKERHVHELMDHNGALTNEILTLKSADHLGREVLGKDEGMGFMGHDRVMTFAGPSPAAMVRPSERTRLKTENPLWNWLSFLSPQEARAWDR